MANELEIYRILVTIDIALVAATITAYSIAASLLSFETTIRGRAKALEKRVDEKLKTGEIKRYREAEKAVHRVEEKKEEGSCKGRKRQVFLVADKNALRLHLNGSSFRVF